MSISGKFGDVKHTTAAGTQVCEVTKWTFDPTSAISKYASNKTGGYKKAVPGVFDGKGTVEIKLDETTGMDFLVGATPTLFLHVNASGNDYYEVPAAISGAPIECDIDGGEVISVTYNFETNGAWTANGILA